MAISTESRRAGPFTGNGVQRDFPFAFKVFSADQVKVVVSAGNGESTLDSSAYAVTLEADQDDNPGGVVTLTTPLGEGSVLAILSAVPMVQPMVLTNRGGFYPSTLNDSADRAVILAQQLSERLDRAVTVDATDTMTPSELKQKLLDAATDATIVAKGYAESAKASAEAAAESAASVDAKGEEQKNRVTAEGNAQAARLAAEAAHQVASVAAVGDAQAERLALAGDQILERDQIRCLAGTRTITEPVSVGALVTLPAGVTYVVGFNHLRVCVNGVVLYPGDQYEESGDASTESNQIKLLMPLRTGDLLMAWVVPTGGKKDPDDGVVTPDEATKCQQATWVVDADQSGPVALELPNGLSYIAGKNHIAVSWNGLVLVPYMDFSEVGTSGTEQTRITMLFDLRVGDVLNVWTVPYDRGQASSLAGQVESLQAQIVELSRKVVYKNEESAE